MMAMAKNDGVFDDLKKTENNVYAQIKNDHRLTASAIADLIGLSKPTVERVIATLKKKGYIKREGSDKTGRWITLK